MGIQKNPNCYSTYLIDTPSALTIKQSSHTPTNYSTHTSLNSSKFPIPTGFFKDFNLSLDQPHLTDLFKIKHIAPVVQEQSFFTKQMWLLHAYQWHYIC